MVNDIEPKIKQEKVFSLEKEVLTHTTLFLIGALFVTLFLILVFAGWLLASKNSFKNLGNRISDVDKQLSALKDVDEELQTFSGAVTNIKDALSQKQKWSSVFKELNALTPKDVVYTTFSADASGKVRIDGSTSSLSSLAKLIVSFKEGKVFKNITLNAAAILPNKVVFSLSLELNLPKSETK